MRAERFYDHANNRLVYLGEEATPAFWDGVWDRENLRQVYTADIPRRHYILRTTGAFLPKGSLVLEGGCGLAQYSYFLTRLGYKTIALDYAEKTVAFLKEHRPEVGPVLGDVRRLDLPDSSLDGYWSIGVIEHFFGGHTDILREAKRVLKPGGYLFLTFPCLSPLRRLKILLGRFPLWQDGMDTARFYQFALDPRFVRGELEQQGFEIVLSTGIDGIKGLRDEVPGGRSFVTWLYARNWRCLNFALEVLDRFVLRHLMGHVHLFVCRRFQSP